MLGRESSSSYGFLLLQVTYKSDFNIHTKLKLLGLKTAPQNLLKQQFSTSFVIHSWLFCNLNLKFFFYIMRISLYVNCLRFYTHCTFSLWRFSILIKSFLLHIIFFLFFFIILLESMKSILCLDNRQTWEICIAYHVKYEKANLIWQKM